MDLVAAITASAKELGFDFLKEKQREAAKAVLSGYDLSRRDSANLLSMPCFPVRLINTEVCHVYENEAKNGGCFYRTT